MSNKIKPSKRNKLMRDKLNRLKEKEKDSKLKSFQIHLYAYSIVVNVTKDLFEKEHIVNITDDNIGDIVEAYSMSDMWDLMLDDFYRTLINEKWKWNTKKKGLVPSRRIFDRGLLEEIDD